LADLHKVVQQVLERGVRSLHIDPIEAFEPFLQAPLGGFAVGRVEPVLFSLAGQLLYSIVRLVISMPVKTWIVWDLDWKLPGARAILFMQVSNIGDDK
jgi:hypothetical protein